jgi:class 3 adenylate cyclase
MELVMGLVLQTFEPLRIDRSDDAGSPVRRIGAGMMLVALRSNVLAICDSCGQPVPEGARFCPACGAPQHPVAAALGDEERRVVTVLFADLVGFTSLAEGRDPEQVKRLVDAAFELLVADVESHGGVVDKVLGDAIIALFGAPVAHEDDAERAVRAALTMQATLREFRDEHPADEVEMRVGINTGEVLVGTVAGTDYTAMGDVVNTASRLQGVAEPGTVIVGAATKELCSSVIRFQPIDAMRLRGRAQFTEAWRAVGIDNGGVVRRWASDVRFVGRRSEVAMLEAVTSTVITGRAAIVAVSGEAGIGKSRLVGEIVHRLVSVHPNALVLEGVCAPYGEANVWWPVVGSLLGRFGLSRDISAEEARRRCVHRVAAVPEVAGDPEAVDRMVEMLMHLLGHPSRLDALDPIGTRDAVVGAITSFLRHRAAEGPVVLWIDDLQWAPALLRELLESLGRQLSGLPVLIAATYRTPDEGTLEWPPPVDPALTLRLTLEPLTPVEASELVAAAGTGLAADQASSIANRAGGNPLYLIELVRMATGTGATSTADLPGSLRALVAARLDSLSSAQRAIVDNAAVIGQEGRMSSLRVFADAIGQGYDPADFAVLVDAGLMVRSGSRWRFRSDVVREVAYQTLTKQTRAQRHAGVARHMAEFEPAAIDPLAHHMATAAELRMELGSVPDVPDDIGERAVQLLLASAYRWQHQGANRRSLGTVERALNLHLAHDPQWRELALLRTSLLVDLRELRRARKLADELIELSDAAGDRITSAEANRLIGTIEQHEGDLVAARHRLSSAVAVFRDLGDERRLAEALRARGFAEVFGGSLADADRFLDEAATLYE